jgi:hypothetical protein
MRPYQCKEKKVEWIPSKLRSTDGLVVIVVDFIELRGCELMDFSFISPWGTSTD